MREREHEAVETCGRRLTLVDSVRSICVKRPHGSHNALHAQCDTVASTTASPLVIYIFQVNVLKTTNLRLLLEIYLPVLALELHCEVRATPPQEKSAFPFSHPLLRDS